MESKNFLNSPVIQRNTPIKRLGLSRKRKSSGSDGGLNNSIRGSNEKSPRLEVKINETEVNKSTVHLLDYEKELQALKSRISEKEEKLKTLQHNNKNILELEDLIEKWKTGCRNAYLEFMEILREKEPNTQTKDVLTKLGIWETMLEHFKHDSDISLQESSQQTP